MLIMEIAVMKPKKKAPTKVEEPRKTATGSALIPAASKLPSTEALEGLNKYAKTGAPSWFGDLLKFSGKTGEWTAGSQGLVIKKGRLVAVVPEMIAGHVVWKDGEMADQDWLPAFKFDPRDHRAALEDHDQSLWPTDEDGKPTDPWKEAVMLPMVDPNTRAEFTFSSSSYGGVKAAKQLVTTYLKQLAAAPETTKGCLPVVALGFSSYKHPDKKRGTIFNPVFEGIDWMRASDLTLPSDPGHGEEPPPDPDIPLAA
jgi:hypothetical protein